MTSDTEPLPWTDQEHDEDEANNGASQAEAHHFWGYLIKDDKCGKPMLDRLLRGIAAFISQAFEPSDSHDITPSQLAAWYRHVGGNYDVLFLETPPSSISFIYRSLGAHHSLQPSPKDDGYSRPNIPALKKQGFVTWQTIQLLLGPEEHVLFLQRAVERDRITDPETGDTFPSVLPKECFPSRPDEAMETWYQGVADRLRREAEDDADARVASGSRRLLSDGQSEDSSADDKHGAADYFEDPIYRNIGKPRANIMRHVSKPSARPADGAGRALASRVRHMPGPFAPKKRNLAEDYESEEDSDPEPTPTAAVPPQALRFPSYMRPHAPRGREKSASTTESDTSESDVSPSRHATPPSHHRKPRDLSASTPEYFPTYYDGAPRYPHPSYYPSSTPDHRRTSKAAASPQPPWAPTPSSMFATHVAQAEAHDYYDRRPTLPARTSYRPMPAPRWGSPRTGETPYARDAYHARDREGASHAMSASSSNRKGHHRRHSTEDTAYSRERERDHASSRTRSSDRRRDVGFRTDSRDRTRSREDSRDKERNRERERERERDGARMHRYVQGVQDGVAGRRYPPPNGLPY